MHQGAMKSNAAIARTVLAFALAVVATCSHSAPFRFLFDTEVSADGSTSAQVSSVAELLVEQSGGDVTFDLKGLTLPTGSAIHQVQLAFSPFVAAVPDESLFTPLTGAFAAPSFTAFPGDSAGGYDFNLQISLADGVLTSGTTARWMIRDMLIDDLLYGGVSFGAAPQAYFLLKSVSSSGTESLHVTTDFATPAVPEPNGWFLGLAGAAIAGLALRRR